MNCSRFFFFLLMLIGTLSCSNKQSVSDVQQLNGYWEIEKVKTQSGETKEYTINTTIDYIELTDSLAGFRIKVQPMADGTYKSNGDAESFTLQQVDNRYIFDYKSNLDSWKENLEDIDNNHFTVTNATGNTYYYKRYTAIKPK